MLPSKLDDLSLTATAPARKWSRRKFIVRAANAAVGSSLLYSYFGEPRSVAIERVTVPLANLPPGLDGFTIAQLSDLHRGPVVSAAHIRHGVDLALALRADLVALTGDFVTRSAANIASCAAELSRLRAPHGIFAVLGNHDLWTQQSHHIIDRLQCLGAQVLVNQHKILEVGGATLCVLGVDDVWSGRPNLEAALKEVPREAFKLLLAHEPDFADEAARHDIPLQLSGHSHGGQVRIPGLGALVLPRYGVKYPLGLQRVERGATLVYTNRGLGCVNPPVRLNCPPEVTLLTLKRA